MSLILIRVIPSLGGLAVRSRVRVGGGGPTPASALRARARGDVRLPPPVRARVAAAGNAGTGGRAQATPADQRTADDGADGGGTSAAGRMEAVRRRIHESEAAASRTSAGGRLHHHAEADKSSEAVDGDCMHLAWRDNSRASESHTDRPGQHVGIQGRRHSPGCEAREELLRRLRGEHGAAGRLTSADTQLEAESAESQYPAGPAQAAERVRRPPAVAVRGDAGHAIRGRGLPLGGVAVGEVASRAQLLAFLRGEPVESPRHGHSLATGARERSREAPCGRPPPRPPELRPLDRAALIRNLRGGP